MRLVRLTKILLKESLIEIFLKVCILSVILGFPAAFKTPVGLELGNMRNRYCQEFCHKLTLTGIRQKRKWPPCFLKNCYNDLDSILQQCIQVYYNSTVLAYISA